jgi:hypothetical protein
MRLLINQYIKRNWNKLPKSQFNSDEVVIFQCVQDEDYGYGHHSYEGYGVNQNGDIVWCYSSGCSCNGSCGIEHKCIEKTVKSFIIDGIDISTISWKDIQFKDLQVSFYDY